MESKRYHMNNYNLHIIHSKRFKTVSVIANLRFLYDKYSDIYVPLLCKLLVDTSSKYNTIMDINKACAEIYDPSFSIKPIESGSEMIISLRSSFVNEKYTELGMNEKSIRFVLPFLFEPKIVNGGFDAEVFEVEKEKLVDKYKSLKDYPSDYAEAMADYYLEKKGYKELYIDEVIELTKKVTKEELYDYYLKVLKSSELDIFVCGDVDFESTQKIFDDSVKFNGFRKDKINHYIKPTSYRNEIMKVSKKSKNVQSNLVIGCKVINMTKFEREYVFPVYSWILGGGMNSLLSKTVREKNSLCYYIYTSNEKLYGVLKIHSGINFTDYGRVYDFINLEMSNIKSGNFPASMIDNVKKLYYSSLDSFEDSQMDVLGNYISQVYLNLDDLKLKKINMRKVTKNDVIKLSKKVHIDTVFLLEGDGCE